jgi:hypothetical protein
MRHTYTNWKEIAAERMARIVQLEKENRELRERNENLYNAWNRMMHENYELRKKLEEKDSPSPELKKQMFKNITGRELYK